MSQSDPQGAEKAQSLARGRGGFTVEASPLNGVKLDLGIILLLAVILWFVSARFIPSQIWQAAILLAYGVGGMVWIIVRSRGILRRLAQQRSTGAD